VNFIVDDNDDSDANMITLHETSKFRKNVYMVLEEWVDGEKVGYIKGILLNVRDMYTEMNTDEILKLFEVEDKEEQEEMNSFYIQVLSKEKCRDYAFYLTEFFIDRSFRGQGFGKKIIKELPALLKEHIEETISCIYLLPGPLEKVNGKVEYIFDKNKEETLELKRKLMAFYESVGFKQVGKTDFFKEEIQ
jgi:GNAT superfamily N-acetyltransferase